MAPTIRQVENIIEAREVGARLAAGEWRELPGGKWAIPVVAYMSRAPLPPIVLAPDGKGWKVERAAPAPGVESGTNPEAGRL